MFFGIKLFENPTDLELLIPFFYKNTPIPEPFVLPVEDVTIHKETPLCEWFEPHQKDTLFWCVFVGVFGLSEYLLINNKYANREWEEKEKMIISFSKSSHELRKTNHKITLGNIKEMMSEYMTNQSTITLLGLVGLSVFYKVQIYLLDDKKGVHYVYTPENYTRSCFIYKNSTIKGKYRLFLGNESSVKNTFCLDSMSRPLRAISNYKREELIQIARELNVGIGEKDKKEEIYRKLTEYAVWV
jgi:hypothetical protein